MSETISVLYLNPTKQLRAGIKSLSQTLFEKAELTVMTPSETKSRIQELPAVEYKYFQARYVPGVRYTLPTPSFVNMLRKSVKAADLIHVYSYFYPVCTLAAIESSRASTPFVISVDSLPGVNWSSGNRSVDLIARAYTETLGRMTLKRADRVVALSDHLTSVLSNYIEPDRQCVIPNGVNVEKFSPIETPVERPDDTIQLLFVGRLDPVKGITYLLEALAMLDDRYYLTLVGDGTKRDEYERQCLSLGISDRVTFEGYQTDVIQYYRTHDLFILPSLSEGQPTVIMEAQACGLPVIATDVGGASTLIGAGETVPPADTDKLVEAIETFDVDDPEINQQARAHILQQYSETRMGEEYYEMYQKILRDG